MCQRSFTTKTNPLPHPLPLPSLPSFLPLLFSALSLMTVPPWPLQIPDSYRPPPRACITSPLLPSPFLPLPSSLRLSEPPHYPIFTLFKSLADSGQSRQRQTDIRTVPMTATHHPPVLVYLRLLHVIHRDRFSVFDPNLDGFPVSTLRKSQLVTVYSNDAHYFTRTTTGYNWGPLWFVPRGLCSYQTPLGQCLPVTPLFGRAVQLDKALSIATHPQRPNTQLQGMETLIIGKCIW